MKAARLAVAALVLAGCRSDREPVGLGARIPVVHAVLNPARYEQDILAEWLLSGRIDTASGRFDPQDPIRTAAGEPMIGARVVIIGPGGDSVVARALTGADGQPTGIYRFGNSAPVGDPALDSTLLVVERGARYTLRVESAEGHVATATTVVPVAPFAASFDPIATPFDRDRDSLYMLWSPAESGGRYAVTVEGPREQMRVFVPENEYLMAGTLRHIERDDAPRVFVPGFDQHVWVAAVDRSYYDYYRSGNDDFTGRGLLSNIDGGAGVFGSVVVIRRYLVRVTADQNTPHGGRWDRTEGSAGPSSIQLYDEAIETSRTRITGRWISGEGTNAAWGLLQDGVLRMAILRGSSLADTVDVFEGRFEGLNRLEGRYLRANADVAYQRQTQ